MTNPLAEHKSIFSRAVELTAGTDREAFLDAECGSNLELRREVEALLNAYEHPHPILEVSAGTSSAETTEEFVRPGVQVGPYKLLQQIGEGGMGTVWMAEQTQPVQRQVALKVIKAGMDSKSVLARFEAERQALALMDHPNIAKVLDAGSAGGRPYFVMELVKGVPITRYCDEHHLTPRERLCLFLQVCHAVQHAHTKGVITGISSRVTFSSHAMTTSRCPR